MSAQTMVTCWVGKLRIPKFPKKIPDDEKYYFPRVKVSLTLIILLERLLNGDRLHPNISRAQNQRYAKRGQYSRNVGTFDFAGVVARQLNTSNDATRLESHAHVFLRRLRWNVSNKNGEILV